MSVGVGLAVGLYGISFGALSAASGLSLWQTQVLSLFMFSGGSQFAVVGVVAAAGAAGALPAILSAWLLGIRNGFYALRLNSVLSVVGVRRFIAAQLTIDESNAVSLAQDSISDQKKGFWVTGVSVFVFWNLCTLLGALVGASIGDPGTWGLDAAAAAAFLGLIWSRLRSARFISIAVLAAVFTLTLVPIFSAGLPVIAGSFLAVFAVAALSKLFVRLRPEEVG
ncbi:MAG: AzlC family ABC transporter permease [Micrococcales bacterium]